MTKSGDGATQWYPGAKTRCGGRPGPSGSRAKFKI